MDLINFDLNLANYSLPELLKLFNLNYNFGIEDLKASKKVVMQLHPDKSGLNKDYFLFYCKAFRIIKNVYDFKNKKQEYLDRSNSNIEYLTESETSEDKKLLVENILKKNKENFHEWFNKTFEKINIIDEERITGYGDWFKSNEDIDDTETTYTAMHQKISEKKNALSALTKTNTIQEINSAPSSIQTLGGSVPDSYSSEIFSKLSFEDLKKAHTETVVPVGDDDYNKILKFNNVEVLKQYRNTQNVKPMSDKQSHNYLNNINSQNEENNTQLAYKLSRQDEIAEEANKSWWSNLQLLK
jgi:hypothetical protein